MSSPHLFRFSIVAVIASAGLCCTNSPDISSTGAVPDGSSREPPDGPSLQPMELPYAEAGVASDHPDGNGQQCAEEVHAGMHVPVDLLFLVDRSASMSTEIASGQTKWQAARAALTTFFRDNQAAGVGAGLQFFPLVTPCQTDDVCGFPSGASPSPTICMDRRGCVGPDGLIAGTPLCGSRLDPSCPTGSICKPLGYCSLTNAPCIGLGQPCPGGVTADLCTATPASCRQFAQESCTITDYAPPIVTLGDLPGQAVLLARSLATTEPYGGTPTPPAVEAALGYLRKQAGLHPDHREVLVVVTDGVPNDCVVNPVGAISSLLSTAYASSPSIPTYAIGVFAPDETAGRAAVATWAAAGGTGTPFVVSPTDDLAAQLLRALDQVRGSALPCEYLIPKPDVGAVDYMKVNIRVTSGSVGEDLGYVANRDRCDATKGGWYYDVDPATATPTHVIMCEATCNRFRTDSTTRIELRFGCQTRVIR